MKKVSRTWRDLCKCEPCPESQETLSGQISNPHLDTMNKEENEKAKGFMALVKSRWDEHFPEKNKSIKAKSIIQTRRRIRING